MCDTNGAVGVFDSGVGGLTVLGQIVERMPNESAIYLGDTARVPYGTKSADTVIRYARGCSRILVEQDIKLLVVACNTASAYALDALREELAIPVLGVVEPGAGAAVAATRNGRIGVIGTQGTIGSGAYQASIRSLAPGVEVVCRACPLFVPLAEEGWTQGDVPVRVAQAYLEELMTHDIDTLVLGCTHYPLLKGVVAEVMGESVALVDSAEATAQVVEETLELAELRADSGVRPTFRFLVTDDPEGFTRVGNRFLGRRFDVAEWVDVS